MVRLSTGVWNWNCLVLYSNGNEPYTLFSGLATFCILAESFGRFNGSRYNKTISVSIGQDLFRTDVGWPCVIPSGTFHSGSLMRRWSQNKSACRAALTRHRVINGPRTPSVPRQFPDAWDYHTSHSLSYNIYLPTTKSIISNALQYAVKWLTRRSRLKAEFLAPNYSTR